MNIIRAQRQGERHGTAAAASVEPAERRTQWPRCARRLLLADEAHSTTIELALVFLLIALARFDAARRQGWI